MSEGFKKDSVASIISIPIIFEITGTDADGNELYNEVQVIHYFKRPTTQQRERFADVLSPAGRRRASAKTSVQATYNLWKQLIEIDSNRRWGYKSTYCRMERR